jgi:hypothetical protein
MDADQMNIPQLNDRTATAVDRAFVVLPEAAIWKSKGLRLGMTRSWRPAATSGRTGNPSPKTGWASLCGFGSRP